MEGNENEVIVERKILGKLLEKAVEDYNRRIFYYNLMMNTKDGADRDVWEKAWMEFTNRDSAYCDLAKQLFGISAEEYYDVIMSRVNVV